MTMPIFKRKDENFFKRWSPEMAYVLGFIAADGSLSKNKRGAHFTEIQSVDKEIVYKIRDALQSNLKIGEYQPRNQNHQRKYRLQIGSKQVFKDLVWLGVKPRKSKTIQLPQVPVKYFPPFLRGYFDGDGCVNICKYLQKGRSKMSILLNCGFTSGSKDILASIRGKLLERNIVNGGTLHYHARSYRLWFAKKDSVSLYKFMYGGINGELFLGRKRQVFEKYLVGP